MVGKDEVNTSGDSTPHDINIDHKQIAPEAIEVNTLDDGRFDAAATKRLLRKIDWFLIPFLALLYLLSFLDRTSIGNARLVGLEVSLGMNSSSLQYNVALSAFFPWLIAAEIPSNLAMKRFRPSIWIPSIMVAWAVACIATGLVHNYAGLLATRMALGLAEGGLFPGIAYYITLWYKRHECGFRMALFISAATAAGAFGGLLARAIMEMDGVAGLGAWRWIFIIEGIATFLIAIIAYFVMYDYPDTAKFLTSQEKHEIVRRLEEDRSVLDNEFDIKYIWDALKDWRIWVQMLISIGIYTPLYSFSLFLPTIISNMGFTNPKTAQLVTVPPYAAACICCISAGWLADKWGQRGIFMIFFNCIAILGFALQIVSSNLKLKYAGTFFAAMGIYPNVPQGVAWNGNNIGGATKRGVGIAMQVGFGNLGGIISGFLYRTKDSPMFYPGHGTLLAMETLALILCMGMTVSLRRENARRDREFKAPSEYTRQEMDLERTKGDNATFFRYTV